MAVDSPNALSRRLRRAAGLPGPSDEQLLARFVTDRDEHAFAELVGRHGPMVLGVCRRVAGNAADADDAFQVTFLVLARKAAAVASRWTVGGWLYGVARRAALKTRATTARRRARESAAARHERVEPTPEQTDVLAVVEQELGRLPAKYREPLVLCALGGRPRKDVAEELGVPEGTLASRLATARRMLADRLRRRGLVVPAAAAFVLSEGATTGAAVSADLAHKAVAGATGAPRPAVARLASQVALGLRVGRLRAGVLALAVMVTAAAGWATAPRGETAAVAPQSAPARQPARPEPPPATEPRKVEFTDEYGLNAGRALKLVPAPFPVSRKTYYEAVKKTHGVIPPAEKVLLVFTQAADRVEMRSMIPRYWDGPRPGGDRPGRSLEKVLMYALDVLPQEVEGPRDLLAALVDADVVVRKGATERELLAGLRSELRDKFGMRVVFTAREEEREVVVATGKWAVKRGAGDEPTVDVYAHKALEEPSAVHAGGGMLAVLGTFVNRRVVDRTDTPAESLSIKHRYHQRLPATVETTAEDTDPAAVLRTVAAQTGLTFTTEKQRVRVLFVEQDKQ